MYGTLEPFSSLKAQFSQNSKPASKVFKEQWKIPTPKSLTKFLEGNKVKYYSITKSFNNSKALYFIILQCSMLWS